jgi:hypothetical protein
MVAVSTSITLFLNLRSSRPLNLHISIVSNIASYLSILPYLSNFYNMFDVMDRTAPTQGRPQHGHRRNKSSTSVLKAIITSKSLSKSSTKGKENTTPPQTSNSNNSPMQTPIWAEFSSDRAQHHTPSGSSTKIPLNDRSVEKEINLYTPREYSPSKQRNLHDIQIPSLVKKDRPKSEYLPKSKSSISVFETFNRKKGDNATSKSRKSEDISKQSRGKTLKTTKVPLKEEGGAGRVTKATRSASKELLTMARKGTKVMGLVAAFNSKSESLEDNLDPKQIDAQFEAVLVSSNSVRLSLWY